MGSDTTLFHGTDSSAYRVSERIRLGHNRFFLRLLSGARGGKAFAVTDRVLDVGCGDAYYFLKLWKTVVPEFGSPQFVQGIDSQNIQGRELMSQTKEHSIQRSDFFDYSEKGWDVIYSSFCHTWLRAPREQSENEADRDDLIANKLHNLLKPGGWFAAHYPGESNYFPYYNRLILDGLKKLRHPLGDDNSYWNFRARHLRVPQSLEAIRGVFNDHHFTNTVLLKSIEWIAVNRETEFLGYLESGGRKLLQRELGDELYAELRALLGETIADPSRLQALGLKTFPGEKASHEFILLPTYHIYHVAQRQPASTKSAPRPHSVENKSPLEMPFSAIAALQFSAGSDGKRRVASVASVISQFLKTRNRDFVYLAVIEAGGKKRRVESPKYGNKFQDRERIVGEGAGLKLPTMTEMIFEGRRAGEPKDVQSIVAAFAHITDRPELYCSSVLTDCRKATATDKHWMAVTFLWPQETLQHLQNETGSVLSQQEAMDEILARLQKCNDWPRLIVQSDAAFKFARGIDVKGDHTDLSGLFRYFLWQSRVGATKPISFLVFPQRLERLGDDGSHTCFLMWQENGDSAPRVTDDECALLMAMQPLAMTELANEAEELGERQALSTESHEGRDVAGAVRNWPIAINSLFDIEAAAEHPKKDNRKLGKLVPYKSDEASLTINDVALIPFPDLFRAATSYLVGWSLGERPNDLPFCEEDDLTTLPQTFDELARKSLSVVLNVAFMHCKRDHFMPDSESLQSFANRRNTLFAELTKLMPSIVAEGKSVPLVWEQAGLKGEHPTTNRRKKSVWLSRLLLHLSREYVEHGDLTNRPEIIVKCTPIGSSEQASSSLSVEILWKNRLCARKNEGMPGNALNEIVRALRRTRKEWRQLSTFRGKNVKEFVAHQIDPNSVVQRSSPDEEAFWVRVKCAW